jgi:hypothetical protein
MKLTLLSTCAFSLLIIRAIALPGSQREQFPQYEPGSTKVAVLPAVDLRGNQGSKESAGSCRILNNELSARFRQRGFVVVPPEDVAQAMTRLNADLADDEQRKRARMFEIGKAANADLVVFATIESVEQSGGSMLYYGMSNGRQVATIKIWLLDVGAGKPLLSAQARDGKGNDNSGALKSAVGDALDGFLRPYKKVKR